MNEVCFAPFTVFKFLLKPESISIFCFNDLSQLSTPINIDLYTYLKYFLMTLLLESPVYFLVRPRPVSLRSGCFQILILNLATHPFLVFALPFLLERLHLNQAHYLLIAETFAPLVEWILLWRLRKGIRCLHALMLAVIANLISWWLGLIILSW